MSHFTVLVIGPDPVKQLQPFHEFECTGENDEFVKDIDITTEVLADIKAKGLLDGLEWHGLNGDKVVDTEAKVNRDGAHKYGYAVVRDDVLIKAVKRTNPNRKWDWHQLGGRWTGYFKLLPGENGSIGKPGLHTDKAESGYADRCMKCQIDIQGMRAEAGDKAGAKWDKVSAAVGDAPPPEPWESVLKRFPGDISGAREFYQSQLFIQRMSKDKDLFWLDAEEFQCTKHSYVQKARNAALVPFAILHAGKWVERGQMGWFGCVANEKDDSEWIKEGNALIDSLPYDTLMSIYDCHI